MQWQPISTVSGIGPVDLWIRNPALLGDGYRVVDCIYRDGRWWNPVDFDQDYDAELDGPYQQAQFPDASGFFEPVETPIVKASHWMVVTPP